MADEYDTDTDSAITEVSDRVDTGGGSENVDTGVNTGWDFSTISTGGGTPFIGDLPDIGGDYQQIDVTKEYGPEAAGYTAYKDPATNKVILVSPKGEYFYGEGNATPQKIWDPDALKAAPSGIGSIINDFAKSFFTSKDASGKVTPNLAAIGGLAAFLTSSAGKKLLGTGEAPKVGYQGSIPTYTAVRERVGGLEDIARRPGSGGRRYFTDTTYVDPSKTAELQAAQTAAQTQAAGLAALNAANPFYQKRPESVIPKKEEEEKGITTVAAPAVPPASKVIESMPVPKYDEKGNVVAAYGGLMNLAKGRYLNGATDGMADKIPANIEGKQPAKLSHGEFVVPADVVSHLGNGNSEAGAKRLYDMMDKIRHARTGTTKQGKQINPNKYLPA